MGTRLIPLEIHELYVSAQPHQDKDWKKYAQAPTFYGANTLAALFLPANDSDLVHALWAKGDSSFMKQSDIKIFNVESLRLKPAFEKLSTQ